MKRPCVNVSLKPSLAVLLSVMLMTAHSQESTLDKRSGLRGLRDEGALVCRILSVDVEYDRTEADEHNLNFRCLPEGSQHDEQDGLIYSVDLPQDFLETHPGLENGETYVVIPNGRTVRAMDGSAVIVYPSDANVVKVSPMRRQLAVGDKRTGVKSLLILRVTANDGEVKVTQQQLSARIFGIGTGAPSVNVRSQYNACSFGKFRLNPAQGRGIVDGVAQIKIDTNVIGADPFNLENIILSKAESQLGKLEGIFDHVMFCLPPGSLYGATRQAWYAYGYINWYRSVFNDEWCGYYSASMHELGHNLALQHSSEGSDAYGDQSGMMGYSYAQIGGPSLCFNGHKNWLLGWYRDRAISLDGKKAWTGRLLPFVDYDQSPLGTYVLINIGDIYIQYNRAKRFNSGTRERKDQVTIVRGTGDTSISVLLGSVALNLTNAKSTYRVKKFETSGYDLVIEACEQVYGSPEYVRLSIYLDNGVQSKNCIEPRTDPPSRSPTSNPTSPPSVSPSAIPSPSPTRRPSHAPSNVTCDDSMEPFRLGTNQSTTITCLQLSTNKVLREQICVPQHLAYKLCGETCGACTDSCEDLTETFYVNRKWGNQNCNWLSLRSGWQKILCQDVYDAYRICGETCGNCESWGGRQAPTVAAVPVLSGSSIQCADSPTGKFVVNGRGKRTCAWLSVHAAWQSELCVPEHDAYHACKMTCRSCINN